MKTGFNGFLKCQKNYIRSNLELLPDVIFLLTFKDLVCPLEQRSLHTENICVEIYEIFVKRF